MSSLNQPPAAADEISETTSMPSGGCKAVTRPKLALDYVACTLEELEHFSKSRGLILQPSLEQHSERTTAEYVEALCIADDNYRFRFLDLPGELRNEVYEDLLILRENTSKSEEVDSKPNSPDSYEMVDPPVSYCYPEILATCKTANQDATSLLYGNTLKVDCFEIRDFDQFQTFGEWEAENRSDVRTLFQLPNLRKRPVKKNWCLRLLRCSTIHINIVDGDLFKEYKKSMLHCLLSMLQTSSELKKVTISTFTKHSAYDEYPARFKDLYHIGRLCALFEVEFQDFYSTVPERISLTLIERLRSMGNKEFYKKNFLVRLLHLGAESSRCQTYANLLQLNSDERKQLSNIQDRIARARRSIQCLEEEQLFARSVEELVPLLDKIYQRTTRAQKYALSLQGSATESIQDYQDVHEERVEALQAENIKLPSREALCLYKKDLKDAKDYWEKDARRGRWYGLGLENKFTDIEKGVKDRRIDRSKQRNTDQEFQERLEAFPEQCVGEGLTKLFDAGLPITCDSGDVSG